MRHLHPEQLRFQVQRRLLGAGRRRPADAPAMRPRAGSAWGPRQPRCHAPLESDVLTGEFRAWGRSARVSLDGAWTLPGLGLSWNYPVHYFDALRALTAGVREEPQRAGAIARFMTRWIESHPPGSPVAWDPYPTAIRLVNWVEAVHVLAEHTDPSWRDHVLESIHTQARWLASNLERHLLGTHLLKDLKALLVVATCFDDDTAQSWRREASRLLARELHAQVDADGAHAEPSAMYHCMALEDVLDLLNFRDAVDERLAALLHDVARRMLRFAHVTRTPDGGYALRGDAWSGGAPTPNELVAYAQRLGVDWDARDTSHDAAGAETTWTHFATSGVAVWRDASTYVLADVGGMGTPHLAAHGHCDSLAFELWMGGQPWIVDSGTWTYEPGHDRHACRSTRAHNTLEIDAREQHEIWGAFRVARRSDVHAIRRTETALEATLVPWFARRLRARRQFAMHDGNFVVRDVVEGDGVHRVDSRFHVHPDCDVRNDGMRVVLRRDRGEVVLDFEGAVRPRIVDASAADGFAARAGEKRANASVVLTHEGALPYESTVTIRGTR